MASTHSVGYSTTHSNPIYGNLLSTSDSTEVDFAYCQEVIKRCTPSIVSSLDEKEICLLFSENGMTFVDDGECVVTLCFKAAEKADRLFVLFYGQGFFSYFHLECRDKEGKSTIVTHEVTQHWSHDVKFQKPIFQLVNEETRWKNSFEERLLKKTSVLDQEPVKLSFSIKESVIEFINLTKISNIEEVKSFFEGTVFEEAFSQLELKLQVKIEDNFRAISEEVKGAAKELLTEFNTFQELKEKLQVPFQNFATAWQDSNSRNQFQYFMQKMVIPSAVKVLPDNEDINQAVQKFEERIKKANIREKEERKLKERKAVRKEVDIFVDGFDWRSHMRYGNQRK
ncbi:MAG: hypothetical protein KDK56_06325 [Simkania sp.]|nr:hypothetical protein [Simkania sp.]